MADGVVINSLFRIWKKDAGGNNVEPEWWNGLDNQAKTLINDAFNRAQSAAFSTWSDWWRYATDHKADIGLAVGGVASVGAVAVLTGGTALVPAAWAAGTKAVTSGISAGWTSWTRSAAEGRIAKAQARGVTTTTRTIVARPAQPNVQNGATMHLDTINAAYKEGVLQDALKVFENGGLQRLYDAFLNMRGDFDKLRTQWFLVSSGVGDEVANQLAQAKAFKSVKELALSNVALTNTNLLKECGPLSSLWEGIFRCEKRFNDVGREGALLEDFITYVTLMVSQTTSDSSQKINRLWRTYFRIEDSPSVGRGHDALSTAANRLIQDLAKVTSDGEIQKVWGGAIARAKNPGVWAWDTIVGYLNDITTREYPNPVGDSRTFASCVQTHTMAFRDPTRFRELGLKAYEALRAGGNAVGVGVAEYVLAPFKVTESGTYIQLAMGVAQDYAANPQQFASLAEISHNVGYKAIEQFHTLANVGWQGWSPTSLSIDWENLASGGQIAGELLVGLLVKWAVKRETTKRLNDPSTPLFDRVVLLKELAEGEAADYIKGVENLVAAKQKVNSASSHTNTAEAILRYVLAERAFYMNPAGHMFEGAAQVLAEFRVLMRTFQQKTRDHTKEFFVGRPGHPDRDCANCCYRVAPNAPVVGQNAR